MNPQELTEARLHLHYAVQFPAVTAGALVEPQPDYSHTALAWNDETKTFISKPIMAEKSFQVAVNPIDLTLLILDQAGQTLASLPLPGQTLAEGFTWLKAEIAKLGAVAEKVIPPSYPPEDFPDHAIAHGAAFDDSQAAGRQELAHYYALSSGLLEEIARTIEGASAVHIWPHHFDMATLISLPGEKAGEALSIGVGFSPGDVNYNEPYWYIAPWPYPDVEALPPLDGKGWWHTQNWIGAVLTASHLGGMESQQLKAFLDGAVAVSHHLLLEP